ncbi:hypothetical protein I8752_18485 [Nostocaceae cyanobacterium CENA369]|uniref:Uncharacterized protein n=1 Tax=Dendronalium phyllosphericum CENA369 TaxID=1725256 RepID=A0A8J7I3A2_9NOST|nr:hypothetical protein [Dendronalium phyllosphericum]MBH8574966.1 hypothetical protein [Dendronalium phyllosphericum CENA369]
MKRLVCDRVFKKKLPAEDREDEAAAEAGGEIITFDSCLLPTASLTP